MTLELPTTLEKQLLDHAALRDQSIDELVRDALDFYLSMDKELMDEIACWQQLGMESLAAFEESLQ